MAQLQHRLVLGDSGPGHAGVQVELDLTRNNEILIPGFGYFETETGFVGGHVELGVIGAV